MRYPVENFTPEEEAVLRPHFTNLDRPGVLPRQPAGDGQGRAVRPLLALSGHAAAPLPGGVRRRCPGGRAALRRVEGERAAGLYERVFMGYGDDSIAQVGGAHVACEWVSNVLTKVLQRGRLAAYLEQSTRYIPYDQPMPRRRRRLPLLPRRASSASPTGRRWTSCSGSTRASLEAVGAWAAERWPRGEEPEAAWRRSIRAKALDLLRGLLPAVDPEPRRHLRLRPGLRAAAAAPDGLAAARGARIRRHDPRRARQGDPELRRPGRAPRPRRRVDRLPARPPRGDRAGGRPAGARPPGGERRAVGRADRASTAARRTCSRRRCSSRPRSARREIRRRIEALDPLERAELIAELAGERAQPPPPARAAAGRRSATGSRSSPTTAASATCSATGC